MADNTDKKVFGGDSTDAKNKASVENAAIPETTEKTAENTPLVKQPEQSDKTVSAQKSDTTKNDKAVKDTPESKQSGDKAKADAKPQESKPDKEAPKPPNKDDVKKHIPVQNTGEAKKPQTQAKKDDLPGKSSTDVKPTPDKVEAPHPTAPPENVAPEPEPPRDANRINEKETIVYISHADLHPFKNHPFQVRDDDEMKNLITSVKERGVDQAAIVRPREGGGFEIIAGHRRQFASEQAGIKNVPCVVRNMTDDEAILAMTESNFNQRSELLASERAMALKMQLDAIKRQGERFNGVEKGDVGRRSNEIVAERNKMSVKNVQRYISLNNIVPELMKFVDDKKIPFTAAVEMSYIRPKNQSYIAVNIEAQESSPSLQQSQRMRELDKTGALNSDVIDGIMLEEKKEELKVIITGQELSKYFGAEKSPKEMKDTIIKLLDDYKAKQPPELDKPGKSKDSQEK